MPRQKYRPPRPTQNDHCAADAFDKNEIVGEAARLIIEEGLEGKWAIPRARLL